jgi:hypothetical protein
VPGIQLLPGDTSRPSVLAIMVVVVVILVLGVRLRDHASHRNPAWSETTHWIINVFDRRLVWHCSA